MEKEKIVNALKKLPLHDRILIVEEILNDIGVKNLKQFVRYKITSVAKQKGSRPNNTTYTDLDEE